MRFTKGFISIAITLASTLPAWLAAQGVQLPESMRPQPSHGEDGSYLVAQDESFDFGRSQAASQRPSRPEKVEIVREQSSGRDDVVAVDQSPRAQQQKDSRAKIKRHEAGSAEKLAPQASAPQASISHGDSTTHQVAAPKKQSPRKSAGEKAPSLASALYPVRVSTSNPYGNINDTRGLHPYKPGVKYDRERDSSFFGALFGR